MVNQTPKQIIKLAQDIEKAGGRALLVGGCVRDLLLQNKPTDYDVEVFGLEYAELKKIAAKYGNVVEAGKSFGVLKVVSQKGPEIDIALPRRDSKTGTGHRGFKITTDSNLSHRQAARRRDFTINSILLDPLSGEIIDPFGGVKDLLQKKLKVTDAKLFGDDPLRALRAMQFAARFELKTDAASAAVIKRTAKHLHELSKERIFQEWRKLLLKSSRPSLGLQLAYELQILDQFGSIFKRLATTKQNKEWHSEGNAWTHTKMVTDKMAEVLVKEDIDQDQKLTLMLAAMCHDFGKPATTKIVDGKLRSFGHAEAGIGEAETFLKAIGTPKHIIKTVSALTKHHMRIHNLVRGQEHPSDKAIRRLVRHLDNDGLNIAQLYLLSVADWTGRNNAAKRHAYPEAEQLYRRANKLQIGRGPAKSPVNGQDLFKLGFKQGPQMGKVLHLTDQLADEGLNKKQILSLVGKVTKTRRQDDVILELHKHLKKIKKD